MSSPQKIDGSTLTGVSETALMTLQVRASEARRPDGIIEDPVAVELVDRIDFDFAKFGYSGAPTWRCARWRSTAPPSPICGTTRRPPWWRWPRACRPVLSNLGQRCRNQMPLADS